MTDEELRICIKNRVLIMRRAEGFYFIAALPDVPLRKQAQDNAKANPGTVSVESVFGEVLWDQTDEVLEAGVIL
jgi:hypothetical protein